MTRDRAQELVALERVQLGLRLGVHGRRPGHVAEESDLAEVVAGAERRDVTSVDEDIDFAGDDDVEAIPGLALLDDLATGSRPARG